MKYDPAKHIIVTQGNASAIRCRGCNKYYDRCTCDPPAKKEPATACWAVELNTECPYCRKEVDLLDYPDFWDAHRSRFEIGEHETENTRGVEVDCPECGEEFLANFTY